MATIIIFAVASFIAGVLGGVLGTGSSIILLPILVYEFGPKSAVPIMAIAAVLANIGRLAAWWNVVDWKSALYYSIGSLPGAALGARTLVALPPALVDLCLGCFFLIMIPLRRRLKNVGYRPKIHHLLILGLVIGYLTGIVASVGPLSVTVFAALGLMKGPLLATEAATSLFVYTTKISTFGAFGVLEKSSVVMGFTVGTMLIVGAFLGKEIVLRMRLHQFEHLLEFLMLMAGASLLVIALVDFYGA